MNQSMKRGSQETITLWQDQAVAAPAIPLQENLKTEVAVIGAGISGLSVAYFLQKAGKSVAVIDAWGLGSGDTSRTSAHLTAVIDQRYYKTESLYGEKTARLVAESHMAAINRIETICREEKIDCDFVRLPGYLTAAGNGIQDLEKELPAVKRAGLSDAKLLNFIPELGENSAPALLFPQQAQFDIAKYLAGLAGCFIQKGGKIFTHSPVREISGGKKAYSKTESGYRIDADSIVVATHSPVNDLVTMHTKQAAYRSYIIVCDIDKNFLPPFLFWDTMDPYHYIRLVKN
ncbi:MAG: NAD(P)/FAD-dependent oxidoreductase, partial [Dongiaceae bacterium]